MNLDEILNKTKKKSEKIKINRPPPSIATTDRPYSVQEIADIYSNTTKKTDGELATNRQQTDNKPDTKPTTNWQQSINKLATNRQQTKNILVPKNINWQQTDNKLVTKSTTESATNRQQTDNKPTTKMPFSSLVGLQRAIIICLYYECKTMRSKTTDSITLEYIAINVNCSKNTAKTTLQRLESKGCITRKEFKNGRAGWSKYEIPEYLYHEILRKETDNKLATNWQQTDNKLVTKPTTELTTSLSSSSSFKDLKTTTTEEQAIAQISGWLEDIDIAPLNEIGFSKHHLLQITSQNKLTPELIQQSINAFSFDLTQNGKAKTMKGNPLNFFMGILRKGNPYTPPENYESPEEKAMRIYIESQEKRRTEREKNEKKAFELALTDWISNLGEQEKNSIVTEQQEQNPWHQCLKYLQETQPKQDIDTWIRPLHTSNENGNFVLLAPNDHVKDEARRRYFDVFQRFLGDCVIKVGYMRPEESGHDQKHLPETFELRKYFKNNLWEAKRKEIFMLV